MSTPTAPARAPWQPVQARFGRASTLTLVVLMALLGISISVVGRAPAPTAPAATATLLAGERPSSEVLAPTAPDGLPAGELPASAADAGLPAGPPDASAAPEAPFAPAALPVAPPQPGGLYPPTVNVDDFYVELVPAEQALAAVLDARGADVPSEAEPLSQQAASLAMRELPSAVEGEALIETGIASTYGTGDGFQGNLTACGQVFDTYVPQVAHKTLRCGTLVRVEDAATGRSVTVEVTDRGPYIPGRVVDLSWAAYRQLDPAGPGLREVRVYRVGE